jgi:hypothetical protein
VIKVFKIKPIFLLLLPAFFCLHGWQENYSYIEPGEVFIIGLVAFLCLLGLYGIIYLLTKRSYVLASLMTAFIGTWYLFFGVFVDSLRKVHLYFFSSLFMLSSGFILSVREAEILL